MAVKDTFFSKKSNININGELIDLSEPCVMGIINVTPDSFYSGSRFNEEGPIITRAKQILDEGATFIDIGAYSSRPGSVFVNEETEKQRLLPVLSVLRKHFPYTLLSVDTFRANIAEWAVGEFGIGIVNDISGGTLDEKMFSVIAQLQVPYVLMHFRGTPDTMQNLTEYRNVTKDVIGELSLKIYKLRELGVNDIIVDPGFGFAKTLEQNYEVLNFLDMFQIFELPLMVGISRKSLIYKLLGITPEEALNGSTALHTIALLKGADILRAHDVKEAVETIRIVKAAKLNRI
jgi:dihydropteroate synthase